ncbi:MAG: SDR family oxidoreductase [SAR202 cluster bacterium]|nr:SDR family oxidoreductase [SAR202 cluster bacterium]|tara:strand:+ start:27179 stop:27991 length:813 start_codon:yes stop_codon:yes gene_type:complete
MTDLKPLKDKTAIVTGAGRGIGMAIAEGFAKAGANVSIAARSKEDLSSVETQIKKFNSNVVAFQTDVSQSEDVDALVNNTLKSFGQIDIMVNNAGVYKELALVPFPDQILTPPSVTRSSNERMTDDEFRQIIDTNIGGVFYGCRAVAPSMIDQKYGKIINISSIAASKASTLQGVYAASKTAVNMLTSSLALEWADYGIRVNSIAPGMYKTSMTSRAWDDPKRKQMMLGRIPLSEPGDMNGLVALGIFLASKESDYITGQTIYIDGGLSA